ncbi:MAG: tRNA (guanosine(46)-N7)-methyltransferase TrmB [Sphingomonadales bacterium]
MPQPLAAPRRHVHGRRKGKRLTAYRQGLLETLLPGLAFDPAAARAVPAERRLWLEIGFGKGEHLAWQAGRHPDILVLGCEPFENGVASLLAQIDADQIGNIRIHMGDAREAIDALPDAAVDRVFLLHPDPWPKPRHIKRRFVRPDNLDALARVMRDDAELRLGTDDAGYSAWSLMQFSRHPAFAWPAETAADWQVRPDDWPQTRYEQKAARAGRRSVYLRLRRRPRAEAAL